MVGNFWNKNVKLLSSPPELRPWIHFVVTHDHFSIVVPDDIIDRFGFSALELDPEESETFCPMLLV